MWEAFHKHSHILNSVPLINVNVVDRTDTQTNRQTNIQVDWAEAQCSVRDRHEYISLPLLLSLVYFVRMMGEVLGAIGGNLQVITIADYLRILTSIAHVSYYVIIV